MTLSLLPQALLGPTSCTIPAGQTFCVIVGVAYPSTGLFDLLAAVTTGPPLPSVLLPQMYIDSAHVSVAITAHTPNPSDSGQPIAVSASVSAPSAAVAPNGNRHCGDPGLHLPFALPAPATSSSGTLIKAGTFFLDAYYGGDSAFMQAVSSAVSHTVNPSTVPPALASAVAAKSHGSAGTFALPLALTPLNPTTEPRQGPTHSFVLNFDKTITAATATVTEGIATVSNPFPLGTQVFFSLSGVADRQYVTISSPISRRRTAAPAAPVCALDSLLAT